MDVKDEHLLIDLPSKPDWFDKELEAVEVINGKPLFRCVDGQREMAWRNGKMDVKYLLQSDNQPCYVRLPRYKYRRKNAKTGEYSVYGTKEQAKLDKDKNLSKLIETGKSYEVRAVGRPCWVIEVLIPPENIPAKAWSELRYQWYQKDGVMQQVDVLGEYPREGRYIFCVDVIDNEGNTIAPHRRLIEELKRRKLAAEEDRRTPAEAEKEAIEAQTLFEKKQAQRITDNFYQEEGITARRLHHGAVSFAGKEQNANTTN